MIGKKVNHIIFGIGEIIEFDKKYITINFANKTAKFIYPDAFEKFITAEDISLQEEILEVIAEAKEATAIKHLEEEAKKKEEAKKAEEMKNRQQAAVKKTGISSKEASQIQRITGKPMIFYVFQGSTFDKEYKGGYIWAPITNKEGTSIHHWTRLLDVRKGDIILHGYDGYVQAISVAKDSCYDCVQPTELAVEDLWDIQGRRVDCEYILIKNPIKTSQFIDDIMKFNKVKYSPFDKDGNGNMGYLFEINRELARIFIKASVKQNPYLKNEKIIYELLGDEND